MTRSDHGKPTAVDGTHKQAPCQTMTVVYLCTTPCPAWLQDIDTLDALHRDNKQWTRYYVTYWNDKMARNSTIVARSTAESSMRFPGR